MAEMLHDQIVIDADADTIRTVVLDIEHYPDWADGVTAATVDERDAQGRPVRATFAVDAKVVDIAYTISYEHSDDRIAWTLVESEALSELTGSYSFAPDGPGTTVDYALSVGLIIPLPGFIKKKAARQIAKTGLRDLKARCEHFS